MAANGPESLALGDVQLGHGKKHPRWQLVQKPKPLNLLAAIDLQMQPFNSGNKGTQKPSKAFKN